MSNKLSRDYGLVDGQTYIIGREVADRTENYIYINSPTVSRRHATIKIKNGRVHLRDLDSTNGTFVLDNDGLVPFKEGYVSPSQSIVIGEVKCTITNLLAIARTYSSPKTTNSDFEDTKLMPPINEA